MDNFFAKWVKASHRELSQAKTSEPSVQEERGADFRSKVIAANTEEKALKIAAVYRAVDVISNSMAQLIMEYQRYSRTNDCYINDTTSSRGRGLNYILSVRPNERMNAVQFWRAVSQRVIMTGNAFIVPVRSMAGEVERLELITGSVAYDEFANVYHVTDTLSGISGIYTASQIIHIRNTFTNEGGTIGVSTLTHAARTLSIAATNDQQTLDTSAKGGRVKLIIQRKPEASLGFGKTKKDEMQKLADKLGEDIYNKDVSFLNGEGTLTPITMTAVEMQLLESRKFSLAEIARIFGVPRAMLFDDSNSSYKTPEAATIEFLARTLSPRIREIEAEFNAKLLTADDFEQYRYHLCERNLFTLDLASKSNWNKSRIETGLASINELRKENNMPAIANGNDHYVSTNLAIAGSSKLSGEQPTQQPTNTKEGGAA